MAKQGRNLERNGTKWISSNSSTSRFGFGGKERDGEGPIGNPRYSHAKGSGDGGGENIGGVAGKVIGKVARFLVGIIEKIGNFVGKVAQGIAQSFGKEKGSGNDPWQKGKRGKLTAGKGATASNLGEHLGISFEMANDIFGDLDNWSGEGGVAADNIEGRTLNVSGAIRSSIGAGGGNSMLEGVVSWIKVALEGINSYNSIELSRQEGINKEADKLKNRRSQKRLGNKSPQLQKYLKSGKVIKDLRTHLRCILGLLLG